MHVSVTILPFGPRTACPRSEYEATGVVHFIFTAIWSSMVYIFSKPTNASPIIPPTSPSYEKADGVARIPIPRKTLNILRPVWPTLALPTTDMLDYSYWFSWESVFSVGSSSSPEENKLFLLTWNKQIPFLSSSVGVQLSFYQHVDVSA